MYVSCRRQKKNNLESLKFVGANFRIFVDCLNVTGSRGRNFVRLLNLKILTVIFFLHLQNNVFDLILRHL